MKIVRKNTEPEYEVMVFAIVALTCLGIVFGAGEQAFLGIALMALLVGVMYLLVGRDEAVIAPALAYLAGLSAVYVGYEVAIFVLVLAVVASVYAAYDECEELLPGTVIDYMLVTFMVAFGSYFIAGNMPLYGIGIVIAADLLLRATHHWDHWRASIKHYRAKLAHCRTRK